MEGERPCPQCGQLIAIESATDDARCEKCEMMLHAEPDGPDWIWVECDGAGCWCQELGK